jgi:glycosyltransferase involved in cell wall biosynthesis
MKVARAMPSDPLVSVVIPTYNRAELICNTVQNVLAQTYTNVEIIVVNDGSTDKTIERLARFENQIRVLSQANSGPAVARNRGARLATGEFIAFQDSDDLWEPTKLETQVRLLQRVGESVPCCLCNTSMHLGNGRVTSSFELALIHPSCEEGIWLNVAEVLATRFLLFNQAVMIRRRVWDKTKGFDESLKYLEDYDLPLRLSFEGPWAFVRSPLAIYRQGSPGSFSTQGHDDLLVLKHCEIRIFEQALARAKQLGCPIILQNSLSRRLRVFRRELRAITLAESGAWGSMLASRLLYQAERYRYSVFTRLPCFPRMKAISS